MQEKIAHQAVAGLFSGIATNFLIDSIKAMVPWLIAMFMVIIVDLITGTRKSMAMGEHVRFSRALRITMGKMVTYFTFVMTVVFINMASDSRFDIDIYACLFVCGIELCSIISNIIKPKGYTLNIMKAIGILAGKLLCVNREDAEKLVTKDKKKKK